MNLLRSRSGEIASAIALAGLYVFFLWIAWLGLDFGEHYDEWYFLDGLRQAIEQLDGFHRHYTYGGLYLLPGLVSLLTEGWSHVGPALDSLAASPERPVNLSGHESVTALKNQLLGVIDTPCFLIRMRMAFAAVSGLAVVWVYLAGRALMPDSRVAPLLGAAFVALSWEVGYHARFVAADAMLMQFAALQLFLLARFARSSSPDAAISWILVASAAGGFGMGVKLTGIFLWLPVAFMLAFPFGGARWFDWRRRAALLVASGGVMALVFLVTTPGALWDPFRYVGHIYFEILNYTKLPDGHPYYVEGIGQRVWTYVVWLASAVPSPWLWVSLGLAAVATLGAAKLLKDERVWFLAMLAFAAIYVWFVARHPGVYIRNGLLLVPLAALMFAAGGRLIAERIVNRALVFWPVMVIALGVAAANAYWAYDSAMSVREASRTGIVDTFRAFAAENPDRRFWISPGLDRAMKDGEGPAMVCRDPGVGALDGDFAAAFYIERPWGAWPANRPGYVAEVISSREVNYDYAPSWRGHHEKNRIMVLSVERAAAIGFDLGAFIPCQASKGP